MDRKRLRAETIAARDGLSTRELEEKSRAAIANLFRLEEMRGEVVAMFYASFRSEVRTLEALARGLAAGIRVVLPLVLADRKQLEAYEIKDLGEDLRPGYCGIPEPVRGKARLISPEEIGVVLVPGSVFDRFGGRLGYGGGYYDRFLSASPASRVGLAFELQVVDGRLPLEPHDQMLDCLVTEKNVYRFVRDAGGGGSLSR